MATTRPAHAVPRAAPTTPKPAPGIVMLWFSKVTWRVGKIRKKLNTTSSTHIRMLSMLGMRMLPLLRSIELATMSSMKNGTKSMNVPK